jgi:hypothetical protein
MPDNHSIMRVETSLAVLLSAPYGYSNAAIGLSGLPKLGARSRTQAVEQARAFGLLASSAQATNAERQRYEHQL